MTLRRHDILKYSISAATFVGTLVLATGCSMTSSSSRSPVVVAPPAPVVQEPVAPVNLVPTVNAYGEFGSVHAAPLVAGRASSAFQQHTFAPDGRDADVAVDPTGKFVVYSSTRHSDRPDLYLQKVDGVSVVQLTDDTSDDAFPAFAPDGGRIAFCSTRNGSWDIYTMDTDGRQVVQVTNGPSHDLHPSFSPDATRLVYCSMGSRSDNWEIWVVNLSTGERRMIGYGLFPVWSPDKGVDRIAFQRAGQRGSRLFSLWTLDLIDGEARRVTEVASANDAAIVSPAWSPDGQKLAYTTIAGTGGEQKEIWTVSADGTDRRRMTDGVGSNIGPAWAVDNRIYFVSDRGGAESVWSVRAEVASSAVAVVAPKPAPAAAPKQDATHVTHAQAAQANQHAAEAPAAETNHAAAPVHQPAPADVKHETPAAVAPAAAKAHETNDEHHETPAAGPAVTATDTHSVTH